MEEGTGSYRSTLQQLVFIIINNGKEGKRGTTFLLVKGTTLTITEKRIFGKVKNVQDFFFYKCVDSYRKESFVQLLTMTLLMM